MLFFIFWLACAVLAGVWADKKGLDQWKYFVLGVFIGPFALLAVFTSSPVVSRTHHRGSKKQSDQPFSKETLQQEIQSIRYYLDVLQARLARVEKSMSLVEQGEGMGDTDSSAAQASPFDENIKATALMNEVKNKPASSPVADGESQHAVSSGTEIDFARFWLNKIGMGVLLLGIGFFITYSFQYLGVFAKVVLGYGLAGLMFWSGAHMEKKEAWGHYGKVILVGAWALLYFMTFAIYHFPIVQIVHDQALELFLLSLVVIAMIRHALKYKSELVVSGALLFAYLTTTIGDVTLFTFSSNVILAAVLLFLVYRFRWYRSLLLGIFLTFGLHYFWVAPHMPQGAYQIFGIERIGRLDFVYLIGYWLVFMVGAHLLATRARDSREQKMCVGINASALALFLVMGLPRIFSIFSHVKFEITIGLGVIYLLAFVLMLAVKKKTFAFSDMIAGVAALTLAWPLQFSDHTTLMLWFAEAPLLLMTGYFTRDRAYRFLSYVISAASLVWIVFRVVWMDYDVIGGGRWTEASTVYLTAAICMAACFFINRYLLNERDRDHFWYLADMIFSFAATMLAALTIGSVFSGLPCDIALLVFGAGIWWIYKGLHLDRFRYFAYLIAVFPLFHIIFSDAISVPLSMPEVLALLLSFVFIFGAYAFLTCKKKTDAQVERLMLYSFGALCLVVKSYDLIPSHGLTLGWGVWGLLAALLGIVYKDRVSRIIGMCFFGLVLARLFIVDIAHLDMIFKIVTFLAVGLAFLGVSYVYNRFLITEKIKSEDPDA